MFSVGFSMFLSRTVAAEICMEAKTNEAAYTALKRLDKEGVLKFELWQVYSRTQSLSQLNTFHSSVVEDLIKVKLFSWQAYALY